MSTDHRLDPTKHASRPWRINEIAADFDLVDVWALPAQGSLAEFGDLRTILAALEPEGGDGWNPTRMLFALRLWIGERLGWDDGDDTQPIPGCEEVSLRERLPAELVADPAGEASTGGSFREVFATETEAAMELSNATVHAAVQLGWVDDGDGVYRGRMAVYVKHRGWIGRPYMALIAPFRHRIVYPALLSRIGRAWRERPPGPAGPMGR